jgi:hypothetical protein
MQKEQLENDKKKWRMAEGVFEGETILQEKMTVEQAKERCFKLKDLQSFSFIHTCKDDTNVEPFIDETLRRSIAFSCDPVAINKLDYKTLIHENKSDCTKHATVQPLMELVDGIDQASVTDIANVLRNLSAENSAKLRAALDAAVLLDWRVVPGSIETALLVEDELTVKQAKLRLAQLRAVKGFYCKGLSPDEVGDITFFGNGDFVATRLDVSQYTAYFMPEKTSDGHTAPRVNLIPCLSSSWLSSFEQVDENEITPNDSASQR